MPSHGTGPVIAKTELVGFATQLEMMKKYRNIASPRTLQRILEHKAGIIFAESQRLAPVETGRMTDPANAGVETISAAEGRAEVAIVYRTPYAVYVHEIIYAPSGRPVFHDPPTQAKFLEQAVKNKWQEINADDFGRTFIESGREAFDADTDPAARGAVRINPG